MISAQAKWEVRELDSCSWELPTRGLGQLQVPGELDLGDDHHDDGDDHDDDDEDDGDDDDDDDDAHDDYGGGVTG